MGQKVERSNPARIFLHEIYVKGHLLLAFMPTFYLRLQVKSALGKVYVRDKKIIDARAGAKRLKNKF